MKCMRPMTIIVPTIARCDYVGILLHLMEWVMSFLQQQSRIDEFKQLWAMKLQ